MKIKYPSESFLDAFNISPARAVEIAGLLTVLSVSQGDGPTFTLSKLMYDINHVLESEEEVGFAMFVLGGFHFNDMDFAEQLGGKPGSAKSDSP